MKAPIPNKDKNIIDIAFDKSNGRYIAYSTLTGIFVTGVCVESACEEYRKAFFKSKKKPVVVDASGSMTRLPDNEMYGGSLGG